MFNLKPAMYALGLIEGYIESIANQTNPAKAEEVESAKEILQAVSVLDNGLKKAMQQMLDDDLLKKQINLLTN